MTSRTIFSALALLAAPTAVLAQSAPESSILSHIEVRGNQRIESRTVQSYLGLKPGVLMTRYDLDRALKDLYGTGFFADVKLERDGDGLIVSVIENPSINEISFEGNSVLSNEDLEKEVTLKPRSIYTRNRVQTDVTRLLDVYRRNGHYSAVIEPKIIQREQNRVDMVFEVTEGPESSIRNITFLGNDAFTTSTLTSVIRSEKSAWYQFLSSDDKYDPDRLAYDQELLRRYYRSNGYADFKVKSAFAELTPDQDAFYLTFVLEEGPHYQFGNVEIESDLRDKIAPKLQDFVSTKSGEHFDASEIESSIDKMVEALGDRGFAFVDIDPILKRRGEENIMDVTYHVKEGARVYVERINIIGNVSTLDEVVRREFRLVEGDAYSTSKLRRSEQRLRNLGYFENVSVETEEGTAKDQVIINVQVAEQSTGEISLGAGFSSTDGPLADIGVRERNLLGRGQDLRFRVMAAAERQQFDIGFTEPYLFGRDVSGGIDLYKITQDLRSESSFDRDATGGKLRTGYNLSEKLRHTVTYSFEENSIEDVTADASRFIKDQEGTNITSMVGHSFIFDDRDNRFAPTNGWYWRFNQDVAGLGGDDKFLRHEAQTEYYIPVAKQWTLSLAGSAGHVIPLEDDVRINQRFFVGGRELRGFDNSGIGPRDDVTDDALGGNTYYTASTELRFPLGLPEELGFMGAVFVDAGSLWDTDDTGPEVVDNSSLRAAGGIGISWASPFGPIRIDFSKAFLKEDYDIEETFQFSFGTRF